MLVLGSVVGRVGLGVGVVAAAVVLGAVLRRWERGRDNAPSWMTVKLVKRLRVASPALVITASVLETSDASSGPHRSLWAFVEIALAFLAAFAFSTGNVMSSALGRRGLWPSQPGRGAPEPYVGSADKAAFREWLKRRNRARV